MATPLLPHRKQLNFGGKLYYDRAALPVPHMRLSQLLFKYTRSDMQQPHTLNYKYELSLAEFEKRSCIFLQHKCY